MSDPVPRSVTGMREQEISSHRGYGEERCFGDPCSDAGETHASF